MTAEAPVLRRARAEVPHEAPASRTIWGLTPRDLAPVAGLVVVVAAVSPLLVGNAGRLDTSITMATFAIIAVSLGLSYGLGGMLSLAQATFASIGAYGTAIVSTSWGLPPTLGLVLAVAVPTVVAYGMARLIVRLSPLALALATLAFSQLVQLAVNEGGDLTGGYIGISGIPGLAWFSSAESLHALGWALVVLAMLVVLRVRSSNRGRALVAISTDTTLAKSVGIPVNAHLASAFALGGAIAGVAGWYYAHTRGYLAPASLSLDVSFMIAIAVIVGGRRTLLGPIVGTVLIVLLRDLVPGAESHGMFYGGGLILALLLFPEGVMGENWTARLRRIRHRRSGAAPTDRPATKEA
ncbi:branched-chain amino acid ABC transporter permease [Georgenia yuyongxinii]|uniref:Branched-chain amino acid ABC transporter permease n=1 Tax=Georgenia yuyongxinii TaxID=2589797 RepID=A0A552WT12_9MICO|nr:branched-chain amino acid ABC transporter permease [Georgenia yuyongxinii]TRW45884.1 branched-chain amino acid ABC transporter permease [Georgenia yuyongxinii]